MSFFFSHFNLKILPQTWHQMYFDRNSVAIHVSKSWGDSRFFPQIFEIIYQRILCRTWRLAIEKTNKKKGSWSSLDLLINLWMTLQQIMHNNYLSIAHNFSYDTSSLRTLLVWLLFLSFSFCNFLLHCMMMVNAFLVYVVIFVRNYVYVRMLACE